MSILDDPPPFGGDADHTALALALLSEYRRGDIDRLNAMLAGPVGARALDATIRTLNATWALMCAAYGWDPDEKLAVNLAERRVYAAMELPDLSDELLVALKAAAIARRDGGQS